MRVERFLTALVSGQQLNLKYGVLRVTEYADLDGLKSCLSPQTLFSYCHCINIHRVGEWLLTRSELPLVRSLNTPNAKRPDAKVGPTGTMPELRRLNSAQGFAIAIGDPVGTKWYSAEYLNLLGIPLLCALTRTTMFPQDLAPRIPTAIINIAAVTTSNNTLGLSGVKHGAHTEQVG